jgi:hypothetical protein
VTRTTEVIYSDDIHCFSADVFRRVGRICYLLKGEKIKEEGNKKEVLVTPLLQKSGELGTLVVASELDQGTERFIS